MANPLTDALNQRSLGIRQVVAGWPADQPLVMLNSAGRHPRWGRWSVLSSPDQFAAFEGHEGDVSAWLAGELEQRWDIASHTHGPQPESLTLPRERLPFTGGWLGYVSYDLGGVLEPAAQRRQRSRVKDSWPLIELARCRAALVHDNLNDCWHAVGEVDSAARLIEQLDLSRSIDAGEWHTGELRLASSADEHLANVTQTLQYIAAGDIFQANITQQFCTTFTGCTRALARHALALSEARYGAYLEMPGGRCVVSMSPELFLQFDAASRNIVTRPIKGTRPASADPQSLLDSPKDAAELHMITDLMRNDLGRVCEYGSIRVNDARSVETHPTVHHGVSTVSGQMRSGVGAPELLAATFPAGSVTGAPKIRAMQIIEELEQQPRGPYCGAIGMFSRDGDIALNVAIRTMLLKGERPESQWNCLNGALTYGAGGGIVADSDPLAEYRESMDKSAVLRRVLDRARQQCAAT